MIGLPAKPKAPAEPQEMDLSPALRIAGKYPATLKGRAVGILIAEGSDGPIVKAVKLVAPQIGGVTLKDGTLLKAGGELAGTRGTKARAGVSTRRRTTSPQAAAATPRPAP